MRPVSGLVACRAGSIYAVVQQRDAQVATCQNWAPVQDVSNLPVQADVL